MLSDKAVKDIFFELEKDDQILSYNIRELPLYFILRFHLEMDYRYYFENPYYSRKNIIQSLKIKIRKLGDQILSIPKYRRRNGIINSDGLSNIKPGNILFVASSPLTRNAGELVDLYDIIQYYHSKGEVINFVFPGGDSEVNKQSYHTGFYSFSNNEVVKINNEEKKIIKECISRVSFILKVDLRPLVNSYIKYIGRTISLCDRLQKIIISSKAKYVMARSIYTEQWISLACRKTNAKCIEVQHGVVAEDNIYYQTANLLNVKERKLLFPEFILTLGDEWTKLLIHQKSGYDSNNTFTLGVKEELKKKVHSNGETFNVLICLQHGIYSDFEENVLNNFFNSYKKNLANEKINIFIRPHPRLTSFVKFDHIIDSNVKIQYPSEIKFSESLKSCDVLIGIISMSLYEAIARGIPTAAFEIFSGLTMRNGLKHLNDVEDVWTFILQVKSGYYKQEQIPYLSPFNTAILDKFIL